MQKFLIGGALAIFFIVVGLFCTTEANYFSHAYCLLWNWWYITHLTITDVITWISYMLIPVIIYRQHAKADIPKWVALCFVTFIFSCGIGHLVDAITYFIPIYKVKMFVSSITALVSIGTVVGLIKNTSWLHRPARAEMEKMIESLTFVNQQLEIWKNSYNNLAPEIDKLTQNLNEVMLRLNTAENKIKMVEVI